MLDDQPNTDPPVLATIQVELSRAGLLRLRNRIDELLGGQPQQRHAGADHGTDAARSAAKVRAVWGRLAAPNTRNYLKVCASLEDEFTLDDVAAAMGLEPSGVAQVKAYHRNVARTVGLAEPREVRLFETRRDGKRTKLRMPDDIRAAVNEITGSHD